MEFRGNRTRIAAAGAAVAFGSALLVAGATSAQAAGNYQVINGNSSNSCLQVNISGGKGNLVLGTCDRSAKQVWRIAGGIFTNPASGQCLDGNGTDVYTYPCNGGAYQKWTTTGSSPTSIRHTQSGKYLDASGKVGAQVVFQSTIGLASRWVIDAV
ncbi:ricin-type beta-trefoil lectin domain protein [Amycolatopsis carbonis]|uniref:Ricin-type beta-trefoil lectin domain protein n=1 Tax=Amycolatopsis carbonis TaxID=715471 RepID=A0A9Y2IEN6_9PSEU|nr:ricin-type beta-trefoil lectin domain protein [Amycolatopsis sp. 2-15]WIX77133.1 ricin-type beta-trefoil lectin domain protein [Amycolatopsis sp. 2-15]